MRIEPDKSSDPGPDADSRSSASIRVQGKAYQGAVEAVFAVLIATGAGYWVDDRYDTSPFGIFVGAVIGFAAMVLRLLRLRDLYDDMSDEAQEPDAKTGQDRDESKQ